MNVTANQVKVIATSILTMLWPNVPDTTRVIIVAAVISIYTAANAYYKSVRDRSYGTGDIIATQQAVKDTREQT